MRYQEIGIESPITKRWVSHLSSEGRPYQVWEWPMPRIDERLLNCAVYLYPTAAHANKGAGYGGSGFIVAMRGVADKTKAHFYVVTNGHVVQTPNSSNGVIRLNTRSGKVDIIETNPSAWAFSDDADLAAIELDINFSEYMHTAVLLNDFIDNSRIGKIGPGDDTFVVGRLIGNDGIQKNKPTVRFGNIAMMPDFKEGVFCDQVGKTVEAFLVESHTLAGYSGSPVFVHIDTGLSGVERADRKTPRPIYRGPWLLGVDWGHLPVWEPVRELDKKKRPTIETNLLARVSTGVMCVAPAWRLKDLIEGHSELKEARAKKEKQWISKEKPGPEVVQDAAHITGDDILRVMLNTPPTPVTKSKGDGKKRRG